MCQFITIISSIEFWTITVPVIVAIVGWFFNERSKREWEKWQIKKSACLKALNVANAILSNYEYPNVEKKNITPQYESIEDVRACLNELACTCDSPEVINTLKKIILKNPSLDAIVDLRNAVRKELGLKKAVDTDREKAFIGRINCEPPKTD